ncbi:hypothetical protein J7I93_00430 [Bacillus sp. ISL-47]|uniref:hypothetical protein n=1 Tax=Bacillus sp. ISL-47 TaxID=2819130 RepID=UPI001BE6B666|nr:hypothetical protein [Bacillus sp. ISL-47]MBT2686642.1 hypothetical protein [Bacillus sp. ISL-47]MBT2707034.1 hypothetical protein [Pseudomonas sp. ISL-84]
MNNLFQAAQFSSYKSLKDLFETNITVSSIAESIQFCEEEDDAISIKEEMFRTHFDVLGVKRGNEIAGFIERDTLSAGPVKEYMKSFTSKDLISDSTPLIHLLHILKNSRRVFILEKARVTKLVTYSDLQKAPVRMIIFGYITLLEMKLGEIITIHYPGQSWKKLISPGRLEKAVELYKNKVEKNEDLNLVECLQISDKLDLVFVEDEKLRTIFSVPSKTAGRTIAKEIRSLRDELAHANELGNGLAWIKIIEVLKIIEDFLEISEAVFYE